MKEMDAVTASIEMKMQRICELAVSTSIKALEGQKTQLEEEVKKAQMQKLK